MNSGKEASNEEEEDGTEAAPAITRHVVALSGGKDSTAMALRLAEVEPRDYIYVCTPTGDELPEMWDWWKELGVMLGQQIKPVMETTLAETIQRHGCLPNFQMRFCTLEIKIMPYRRMLQRFCETGRVISYVGLRADEEGRAGGAYDDIAGVESRFPFREWGWGIREVLGYLSDHGVTVPERTDCARCYHQRIGEWWKLWKNHPEIFADAVADEERYQHTYRTPGRDSWPTALKELRAQFESGLTPKGADQTTMFRGTMTAGCRVCSM